MRAHVLYLGLQARLGPLPCALESQVLQKVSHAVILRCFVPTARINPHANGCRCPVIRLPATRHWVGGGKLGLCGPSCLGIHDE